MMTALEYIFPDSKLCQYDYEDYCWIEDAYLSLFKNSSLRYDSIFNSRCNLLREFTTDLSGSYLMDKETRDKLEAIEISFEGDTMNWDSCTRRPYYRMRGKKVTEEQATQIINSINELVDEEKGTHKYYLINIDYPVRPDGTVGINHITSKYPNINEMVQDILNLKLRFPYLDFIVAISWWNEIPPKSYDNDFREYECVDEEFREYANFSDNLEIGIWVHGNKIDFLKRDNAKKIYNKYDSLYSDKDLRKYIIDL